MQETRRTGAPDDAAPARRLFAGWDRPGLRRVVEHLGARSADGRLDLERVVVVLPGARAGRRLVELLVEEADRRGAALIPPRNLTAGRLVDVLFPPAGPMAGELLRRLVWAETLRAAVPDDLAPVVASPPAHDDPEVWLALAGPVADVAREVAGEGLRLADVAPACARLGAEDEVPRWEALGRLEARYLERLAELGTADPWTVRIDAVREAPVPEGIDEVLLVGTTDLDALQRAALARVAHRVTALVVAPEALAEGFDAWGCVVPGFWRGRTIRVDPERLRSLEGPEAQGEHVVRELAAMDGRYAAEDVAVGVPDEEVVPWAVDALEAADGAAHDAAGLRVERSGPARLLAALGDWLASRRYRELAALVRHPDLAARFDRDAAASRGSRAEAAAGLETLDRFAEETLPDALEPPFPGDSERARHMARLVERVDAWAEPLRGAARPLGEWAEGILSVLLDVYDTPEAASPRDRAGQRRLEALEAVHDALRELAALPAAAFPPVEAVIALRVLLGRLARARVPSPPERAAVELLGWLELPLDDAPCLLLTGMNEGRVPASRVADRFLPDRLRRELGLADDARRHARDAWAFEAMLSSREDAVVACGRRSADGDPLRPSRLLLAVPRAELPGRVEHLIGRRPDPRALPLGPRAGAPRLDLAPAEPEPPDAPMEAMAVTWFREYLACPFGFWLRRVRDLQVHDDSAEELDPLLFGNLAHDVVEALGSDDALREERDEEALRRGLAAHLERCVRQRFGRRPRPAVEVQVEQLRWRLGALAEREAAERRAGWRIEAVELGVAAEDGVALDLEDGARMLLKGRIDRVDRKVDGDGRGALRVLDYKTGDTAAPPQKTHNGVGGEIQDRHRPLAWHDLQLPLYRTMLPALGWERPSALGYITLAADSAKVGVEIAPWTAEDLDQAEEEARRVAAAVRAGRFWPPTHPVPGIFRELAPIYGDERALADALADAPGDAGEETGP